MLHQGNAVFLFVLAFALDTGAMLMLEPWMIVEAVDAAKPTTRQMGGYALIGLTLLAVASAAVQFYRARNPQLASGNPPKKIIQGVAGLVLAGGLFLLCHTGASLLAQWIGQPG